LQQGDGRRRARVSAYVDWLLVEDWRFAARGRVGELPQPSCERRRVGGERRVAAALYRQREHCELFDGFGDLLLARAERSRFAAQLLRERQERD
jgi:hypothetical protein